MTLRLRIDPPPLSLPAPVTALELQLPANLGLATSGLGLATCEPAMLLEQGAACARRTQGWAGAKRPSACASDRKSCCEHVTLAMFAAPSTDGYIHLAILAEGREPIIARIVMPAVFLPGGCRISVPIVPSLPGAPDVSVLALTATLGREPPPTTNTLTAAGRLPSARDRAAGNAAPAAAGASGPASRSRTARKATPGRSCPARSVASLESAACSRPPDEGCSWAVDVNWPPPSGRPSGCGRTVPPGHCGAGHAECRGCVQAPRRLREATGVPPAGSSSSACGVPRVCDCGLPRGIRYRSVLGAARGALHRDQVLERSDAYGRSVEFHDVGAPAERE